MIYVSPYTCWVHMSGDHIFWVGTTAMCWMLWVYTVPAWPIYWELMGDPGAHLTIDISLEIQIL